MIVPIKRENTCVDFITGNAAKPEKRKAWEFDGTNCSAEDGGGFPIPSEWTEKEQGHTVVCNTCKGKDFNVGVQESHTVAIRCNNCGWIEVL